MTEPSMLSAIAARKRAAAEKREREAAEFRKQAADLEVRAAEQRRRLGTLS